MSVMYCQQCNRHVDTDFEGMSSNGEICTRCEDEGVPLGAIENGLEFARRLEEHYDFTCTGGPLRNCHDWLEFKRCFQFLADHVVKESQS